MAITKGKFISDVELSLFQGEISDDSPLEKDQIAHWIQYHLHDLIRREITAEQKKGNQIPPIYIVREDALEIIEESVTDIDDSKQRMYVELVGEVIDLPRDSGIVVVQDYDGNYLAKASVETLEMVNSLRFAKSSTNNVLYYRIGQKIFIEGFRTSEIDANPIIVYYVPKQDIIALGDDDEIVISDQLIPILMDLVIQRGKAMLLGSTPVDTENDGVSKTQLAYHQQIANVANQAQPDQQQ